MKALWSSFLKPWERLHNMRILKIIVTVMWKETVRAVQLTASVIFQTHLEKFQNNFGWAPCEVFYWWTLLLGVRKWGTSFQGVTGWQELSTPPHTWKPGCYFNSTSTHKNYSKKWEILTETDRYGYTVRNSLVISLLCSIFSYLNEIGMALQRNKQACPIW